MKKILALILLATLLSSILISCGTTPPPKPIHSEKTPPEIPADISLENIDSIAEFSSEFSKKAVKTAEAPENTVFSPLSAYIAMSMMGEGARGNTLEGFQKVFGNIKKEEAYSLITHFLNLQGITLNIANSAWIDSEFSPNADYVDTLANYYLAETFKTELVGRERDVNSWIEDKTNGLIEDMLPSGTFTDESVMALVNTVYMNAKWKDEFDANHTRKREFTDSLGNKSEVDFMCSGLEHEEIIESTDYIGVTLPYVNNSLFFMAVMPKDENMTTDELISIIASEEGGFAAVGQNTESRNAVLYIPTFEQEYAASLVEIFDSLGITDAFTSSADFTGIAESIYIDKVLQNAVIKVDEAGTEAAAATVVIPNATGAAPIEEPLYLEFNRPFAFAVCDSVSGAVLFCGEHNKP